MTKVISHLSVTFETNTSWQESWQDSLCLFSRMPYNVIIFLGLCLFGGKRLRFVPKVYIQHCVCNKSGFFSVRHALAHMIVSVALWTQVLDQCPSVSMCVIIYTYIYIWVCI